LTMSSKKYKNIYINGCSFTAGHNIKDGLTWPELLAKKLNLNLINTARNGQSFDSIFLSTMNHLSELDPNDTLVVIGTTWSTRYSIQFDKYLANITPVDIVGKNKHKKRKTDFEDKLSKYRRASSPYTFDSKELEKVSSETLNRKEDFDKVCIAFTDYYNTLVECDDNLISNQHVNLMSKLVSLQCFLEQHNFDYKIVDFFNIIKLREEESDLWDYPINKMLNDENIVYFDGDWREEFVEGHPTEKGCVNISEVLYDSINR